MYCRKLKSAEPALFLFLWLLAVAVSAGQLEMPLGQEAQDFAVLSPDRLLIMDAVRSELVLVDTAGHEHGQVGGYGTGPGRFSEPVQLCLQGREVLVLDRVGPRLSLFNRHLDLIDQVDLADRLSHPMDQVEQVVRLANGENILLDARAGYLLLVDLNGNVQELAGPERSELAIHRVVSLAALQDQVLLLEKGPVRLSRIDRLGQWRGSWQFQDFIPAALTVAEGRIYLYGSGELWELSADGENRRYYSVPASGPTSRIHVYRDVLYLLERDGGRISWFRFR